MTVSSVETHSGAIASLGSATPTITTSLVPTDRVVVLLMKSATAGTPSVSGLGATWTTLQAGIATKDHYMFTATGVTGGGTVTVSVGSASGDYALWVLRSSVSASITTFGSQRIDSGFIAANTAIQTTDISTALQGMFACAAASVGAGTITFPHANMLPASGWSTTFDGSNSVVRFLHQQLASDSTVRAAASSTTASSWSLLVGVWSDGDTGGLPPLTSTFIGWGNPVF